MKKAAFLIAAVIATLVFLVSCGSGGTGTEDTADLPVETVPVTEPAVEKTLISGPDGTDYLIIIPTGCPGSLNDAALSLRSECFNNTGNNLWVKRDGNQDAGEKEILIGGTNRPESAAASEGLEPNQYRICWKNGKLVAVGGSRSALIHGVEVLRKTYFEGSGSTLELPADLLIEGEIDMKSVTDLEKGWNAMTFEASNNVDLPYQIWLPDGYSSEKEYPCILYMHSAGVRCSDNSHIYQGEAKFLRNLESGRYAKEVIVIAPCCPSNASWVTGSITGMVTFDFRNTEPAPYMVATLELFNSYLETLSIDRTRLYTYGMSMGGYAVWDLLTRNPGVFAAAVPVAGAGDPLAVSLMSDTAIWIFHGTDDATVPFECSVIMRDALAAAGRTDVKFTVFEGAGHGIWSKTADTEGLFDWMFAQKLEK